MRDAAASALESEEGVAGGPLTGVRIIELGTLLAGPFSTRLLGDLGADVIKVEAPDQPDPMREWGSARYRDRTLWWPVQSRNKRCITLDLRTPDGQELLLELAAGADAMVENFRPGTLERWNLGFDALSAVNPKLVLVRVSGFGQTGPYAKRAGFASVAEAMGGLRYLNGYPDQPPPRTGISLGDSLGGMFAALGLLAALLNLGRGEQARGQVVDISLLESCFALLESAVPEYDLLQRIRTPSGTGLKGIAPSNLFRSADGKWLVIAANQDAVFRRLCEAMDMPELADDPRFVTHGARGEYQEVLESIISDWAAARPAAEIDELLNEAGVVCGPVYTIADIFRDPHVRSRDMLVEHRDEHLGAFLGPGVVPKFSATPGRVRHTGPPEPGTHNREVYGDVLGLSETEIEDLQSRGVI